MNINSFIKFVITICLINFIDINPIFSANYEFIQQKKYAIFSVRCSIETDIYYLYCPQDDSSFKQHGICNIPDINTSKIMNNLFRDIKENNNLDALEESDTEEEFENIDPGKYSYLDRIVKMLCVYNNKFNRWQPIKVNTDEKVNKKKKIHQMEKK